MTYKKQASPFFFLKESIKQILPSILFFIIVILVWEYLISGGVWSPPSIADGKVFYGTDPCCGSPTYIQCQDAYTGERIWKYNTGGDYVLKSSPAIAE